MCFDPLGMGTIEEIFQASGMIPVWIDVLNSLVIPVQFAINDVQVTIWDSPGLRDPFTDEKETIEAIQKNCKDVDIFIYCTPLNQTRIGQDDFESISVLSKSLANDKIWDKAIIFVSLPAILKVQREELLKLKETSIALAERFRIECKMYKKEQFPHELELTRAENERVQQEVALELKTLEQRLDQSLERVDQQLEAKETSIALAERFRIECKMYKKEQFPHELELTRAENERVQQEVALELKTLEQRLDQSLERVDQQLEAVKQRLVLEPKQLLLKVDSAYLIDTLLHTVQH